MKIKKIPRYLALSLLTSGASLILGFLSFSGMYVLWPALPLAFASFGLSVAYEGEIYLQNIKGAWNKLFKHNFLKRQLANDYLLKHFPEDTSAEDCPEFFRDYEKQLDLLHEFGHERLDEASSDHKKRVEKTLRDMEKWFAVQLFTDPKDVQQPPAEYEDKVRDWLADPEQTRNQTLLEYQTLFNGRRQTFLGVRIFSALAGIFMSLGTTYLLVEAFSIIPLFAAIPFVAWPLLIVPMALIAGTAYGLLTYNAVTDMISNDTLRKWFNKLREDYGNKKLLVHNIFITITTALLVLLAFALTVCTAGTWWTVGQETRPLFAWIGRLPGFVMGVLNPIITGLSAMVFNLQNTIESLKLIDGAIRKISGSFSRAMTAIRNGFDRLVEQENWLQILNPFRLLLKVTILPLRILLFIGHLVSISVAANRVPSVSQFFSALLGFISEGFEDVHYFVGHEHPKHEHGAKDETGHEHEHGHEHTHSHAHEHKHKPTDAQKHKKALREERLTAGHGHNHDVDLPTRALKFIFSPVYFLAASWDYLTSKYNNADRQLSFSRAWEKQMGLEKEKSVTPSINADKQPSAGWRMEQMVYRIARYREKHLDQVTVGRDVAERKGQALSTLQEQLRGMEPTDQLAISKRLEEAREERIYNSHRFFGEGQTETARFVEELPRIGLAAAAAAG